MKQYNTEKNHINLHNTLGGIQPASQIRQKSLKQKFMNPDSVVDQNDTKLPNID